MLGLTVIFVNVSSLKVWICNPVWSHARIHRCLCGWYFNESIVMIWSPITKASILKGKWDKQAQAECVREVALSSSAGLSSAVLASRADQLLRELDEALASTTVRNECTMDQALLLQPQILQWWQVCRNRLRFAILKLHLMASTTVRNECTMDQALLLQPQILQWWQVCRNRLRFAIIWRLHLSRMYRNGVNLSICLRSCQYV